MLRVLAAINQLGPEYLCVAALGSATFAVMCALIATSEAFQRRDIARFGPRDSRARQ